MNADDSTGDAALDAKITALVAAAGPSADADTVAAIVATAIRMGREGLDRGELKLVDTALDEMRRSFTLFDPHRDKRKCTIFGSARIQSGDPAYTCAQDVGAALAAAGWMVMTGAGPGIMQAGIEGAGAENSFGIGIHLPFEQVAAPLIAGDPKLLSFRYFFTRKLTFMKESHGFVLLPGGFGTMDECFELLTLMQTGKTPLVPVVLLDPPGETYWETFCAFIERELAAAQLIGPQDLRLVRVGTDVAAAVGELTGFYRHYHSSRWVGDVLVLRLATAPSPGLVERLNDEFADVLDSGRIEPIAATAAERADSDVVELPRLGLRFDRRSYARLRLLIDTINAG